jgi:DNA-binding FadR family transcriptional regulator
MLLGNTSLFGLLEARLNAEPELTARVADRATPQDISALHQAIFQATKDRVCQLGSRVLHKLLKSIAETSEPTDVSRTQALYSAIHRRQPEEARELMVDHLLDARRVMIESRPDQGGQQTAKISPIASSIRSGRLRSRH